MDTSLNLNKNPLGQREETQPETAGTIAQNKPSPLFNVSSETAGTIASNSSPSQGGGFCANA